MRIAAFILVVLASALIPGWRHPFESSCATAALIAFLAGWGVLQKKRSVSADDDGTYSDEISAVREFVFGLAAGGAWLALAFTSIVGLRSTPVHGWFVDEQGNTLAQELETLARDDAWQSIIGRFNRPLPQHIGHAAQASIDRYHYLALAHIAAAVQDAAARCAALKSAEAFAESHSIDRMTRAPVFCEAAAGTVPPAVRTRIHLIRREMSPAGRSVLKVLVSDLSGLPESGLSAGNFAAVAAGKAAPISAVSYAATSMPPQLYISIRLASSRSQGRAQAVSGVLAGLIRPGDRIETRDCCSTKEDLPAAIDGAVGRLRSHPGAVILLVDSNGILPPESSASLLQHLSDSHLALHVIPLNGERADPQIRYLAERSGGIYVSAASGNLPALRRALAPALTGEGVYFVELDGKYPDARVSASDGGSPR